MEARIRLLRRAKARKHAHRPDFTTVACRVNATRVGVFTGMADIAQIVVTSKIKRCVEPLNRCATGRHETCRTLVGAFKCWPEALLLPTLLGDPELLSLALHRVGPSL